LHWACKNGASLEIIECLCEKGGEDLIMANNNNSWTALHFACSPTEPSLKSIDTLFTALKDKDVLTLITTPATRDKEMLLPIDILLNKRVKIPHDAILHLQSHWYYRDQRASSAPASFSSKTLASIHGLKGEDADKILQGPFLKAALNQEVIKPFALAVLFLDLILQVAVIIAFSFLIEPPPNSSLMPASATVILSLSFIWFGLRELTQLPSTTFSFYMYIADPSNWFDFLQLGCMLTMLISQNNNGVSPIFFMFCIGVTWLNLVFVFGNLFYRVAVIVSALVSVSVFL
jgi:hypothetical protein